MKNIIKFAIFALIAPLFASCHTELWEQDELTDSKVWVASISSNYKYYCYPEEEYFIVEIGSLLQKYPMEEWSLEQSDESIEYSFSAVQDEVLNIYTVSYSKESKSGTLKIASEDGAITSENYLNGVEMIEMKVDKNYN